MQTASAHIITSNTPDLDIPHSPQSLYEPIRQKILSGEFANGQRLPSIRTLSLLFGLPIRTVLAGLDLLVENGLAGKKAKSGFYVNSGRMPKQKPMPDRFTLPQRKADQIAGCIVDDIVKGNLRIGEYLPLRKTLAYQYKSSTQTLRTALAIVARKGLIRKQGYHYVVGEGERISPIQDCHVIVVGARHARASFGPNWGAFFSLFEKETGHLGITISIRARRDQKGGGMSKAMVTPQTLGVLFPVTPYWMERIIAGDRNRLEKELACLNDMGVPVVLHNCGRLLFSFPDQTFGRYKRLFAFARGNLEAAERLGRYLVSMGHIRICFFSYTNYSWNQTRFDGLANAMAKATDHQARIYPLRADVDPTRIYNHVRRVSDSEKGHIERIVDQLIPDRRLSKIDPTLKTFSFFRDLLMKEYRQRIMRPYFMKAMAHEDATAWVCADPVTAGLAESFLRERGVDVPGQVSLSCMDDDENASFARITCVELPMQREGYLAAHALMGDIPIKRDRNGFVRCPSGIVERGSVARV